MILPFQSSEEIAQAIPRVVDHVTRERLLAYPTETVYGLGSIATERALRALAELKGRPTNKPFLLLLASRGMADQVGLAFNRAASALANHFWPGPLTLVLPGGEGKLPDILRGPEGGIAVRVTSHAGVRQLIAAMGEPLSSTSANRPGTPPAPGAGRLQEVFAEAITSGDLLVLDGGVLGNVPSSTLVDCTASRARLIREGALPRHELRKRVGGLAP